MSGNPPKISPDLLESPEHRLQAAKRRAADLLHHAGVNVSPQMRDHIAALNVAAAHIESAVMHQTAFVQSYNAVKAGNHSDKGHWGGDAVHSRQDEKILVADHSQPDSKAMQGSDDEHNNNFTSKINTTDDLYQASQALDSPLPDELTSSQAQQTLEDAQDRLDTAIELQAQPPEMGEEALKAMENAELAINLHMREMAKAAGIPLDVIDAALLTGKNAISPTMMPPSRSQQKSTGLIL